jgi:eukaryotic-like serine/threonine-protein kinase
MSDALPTPHNALEGVPALIGGRFRLLRCLGIGGMGSVYAATDSTTGQVVAVKLVKERYLRDAKVMTRFAREAKTLARLSSTYIVKVVDAGSGSEGPYLAMELLEGCDLGDTLRQQGKLSVPETQRILAQVLAGLRDAHAAGIVHRDLKPDNVFMGLDGSIKLVDFGISKSDAPTDGTIPLSLTGRGNVIGTPNYIAPEQARALADIDGRADLYSAGAIAFECLTGRPPHTGTTYEQVLLAHCMKDAVRVTALVPEIPTELADVVERALKRERAERFQSAGQFLRALAVFDKTLEVPQSRKLNSRPKHRLALAALLALLVGILATGALLWLLRHMR